MKTAGFNHEYVYTSINVSEVVHAGKSAGFCFLKLNELSTVLCKMHQQFSKWSGIKTTHGMNKKHIKLS